jgi:hypothetical protein
MLLLITTIISVSREFALLLSGKKMISISALDCLVLLSSAASRFWLLLCLLVVPLVMGGDSGGFGEKPSHLKLREVCVFPRVCPGLAFVSL